MTQALSLNCVSRQFGTVQALHEVDLRIEPGQVHAVLGENGAGKSTAVRILAGLDRPDSGVVELNGTPLRLRSREEATRHGIGLIPQSGSLLAELSLEENLALTQPQVVLRRRRLRRALASAAAAASLDIDLATPIRQLGRAQQQLGEVALALAQGARILLLDEPTSVLDPGEIRGLHARLRELAATGVAIVLITHRLTELRAVADVATVLSHGQVTWHGRVQDTDDTALATAMIGDDPLDTLERSARVKTGGPGALILDGVCAATDDLAPVRDINLQVRPAEIVAVVGTVGSGQRALADVAAGVIPPSSGRRHADNPIAYVPEDRATALLSDLPIKWSAVLPQLRRRRFSRFGILRRGEVAAAARELFAQADVRPPDPELPAAALSGGNAQKLVVGRELASQPRVAVLHAPTQGLDLRASHAVRRQIRDAATSGTAVLLIPTDHDEAQELADRVLLIRGGRVVKEYTAAEYDQIVHQLVDTTPGGASTPC
ncbi:ATP-binding cassette domain-containing protein [Amycolatopsis sp. OK19-0408]|uniref:ATP-binding cassette domain-containing protein n=1 Tax=Amycolatopsis iheyensis TaxID=2945988 RepID=A0A9X2SQA0_9PSEU|nr:ATP-binding cassette domain-containing protein [Amycolatopsis iheyensis]MCR6488260.1 ATP-binding cassette domain-containing protein [Amycolatopsis iheyensis]